MRRFIYLISLQIKSRTVVDKTSFPRGYFLRISCVFNYSIAWETYQIRQLFLLVYITNRVSVFKWMCTVYLCYLFYRPQWELNLNIEIWTTKLNIIWYLYVYINNGTWGSRAVLHQEYCITGTTDLLRKTERETNLLPKDERHMKWYTYGRSRNGCHQILAPGVTPAPNWTTRYCSKSPNYPV